MVLTIQIFTKNRAKWTSRQTLYKASPNNIQGQLTEAEAMDLWVGLLTYPEWIYYLEIELALNELYQTIPAPVRTQPQH